MGPQALHAPKSLWLGGEEEFTQSLNGGITTQISSGRKVVERIKKDFSFYS
jgi:hypothetical protein